MTNPLPMPPNHTSRSATSAAREPAAPWREFVRAPLVPFALAATFGLILDYVFSFTLDRLFFATLFAFIAWVITRVRQPEFAAGCLFGTIVGLAASHHHIHRHVFPANDVGQLVSTDTPIVHLRGLLIEPPLIRRGDPTDLFGPSFRVDRASTILDAEAIRDAVGVWHTVTGRVRIRVERPIGEHDQGLLDHVQVGDRVELVGRLTNPLAPGNPGEWNSAEQLLDSRIRAEMLLTKRMPP